MSLLGGESLVYWLRKLVFRGAWLDHQVKRGALEVVWDDTRGRVRLPASRRPAAAARARPRALLARAPVPGLSAPAGCSAPRPGGADGARYGRARDASRRCCIAATSPALLAADHFASRGEQLALGVLTWGVLAAALAAPRSSASRQVLGVVASRPSARSPARSSGASTATGCTTCRSSSRRRTGSSSSPGSRSPRALARHERALVLAAAAIASTLGAPRADRARRAATSRARSACRCCSSSSGARATAALYASVFFVVACLELYGTAIGTWRWARTLPGLGIPDGNPPSGVASGYVWFDVMALATAPLLLGCELRCAAQLPGGLARSAGRRVSSSGASSCTELRPAPGLRTRLLHGTRKPRRPAESRSYVSFAAIRSSPPYLLRSRHPSSLREAVVCIRADSAAIHSRVSPAPSTTETHSARRTPSRRQRSVNPRGAASVWATKQHARAPGRSARAGSTERIPGRRRAGPAAASGGHPARRRGSRGSRRPRRSAARSSGTGACSGQPRSTDDEPVAVCQVDDAQLAGEVGGGEIGERAHCRLDRLRLDRRDGADGLEQLEAVGEQLRAARPGRPSPLPSSPRPARRVVGRADPGLGRAEDDDHVRDDRDDRRGLRVVGAEDPVAAGPLDPHDRRRSRAPGRGRPRRRARPRRSPPSPRRARRRRDGRTARRHPPQNEDIGHPGGNRSHPRVGRRHLRFPGRPSEERRPPRPIPPAPARARSATRPRGVRCSKPSWSR